MIGSFGPIIFAVSSRRLYLVSGFSRKAAARVEEHQVTGGKPRSEFIAPALDDIGFDIFLYSGFGVDPLTETGRLRDICNQGLVHNLVIGGGNLGRFLLTEVAEEWQRSRQGGRIILVKVKVKFKEYL